MTSHEFGEQQDDLPTEEPEATKPEGKEEEVQQQEEPPKRKRGGKKAAAKKESAKAETSAGREPVASKNAGARSALTRIPSKQRQFQKG